MERLKWRLLTLNLDDLAGTDSIETSAVAKGFLFLSSPFEHHSRASIER